MKRKHILLTPLAVLCFYAVLAADGWTANADTVRKATVAVQVLNVRKAPDIHSPILAKVTNGHVFHVHDERYGWLKITLADGREGWIAGQYTVKTTTITRSRRDRSENKPNAIELLYDGTHLRAGPGLHQTILAVGSRGETYEVLDEKRGWYEIRLKDGSHAYVAGWIVTQADTPEEVIDRDALHGKTIVIDPGHGGFDTGAIGNRFHTLEKDLTWKTAFSLSRKLRKAGAHVILTRSGDTYVSLANRVNTAERSGADAFISIHFNASLYTSAHGIASYYYTKEKDKPLAEAIQKMLVKETRLRDRGVRFANYHVLRENRQPATLLELGFLTNDGEEGVVRTTVYRNKVTTAITEGLETYFQQE
ncbi:MAG TPA: N-acetylmuramoyl-L-alanine amidase [Bacillales bacterium]|nr:N-acetylmuramoyl-L-alanine amidase [Bacillales bacterium]